MNFTKEYKRLPREVMETPFLETYLVKALNLLLLRRLHYRQEDEPGGLLTQIICDLQSNTDRNWKLVYTTNQTQASWKGKVCG